MYGVIVRMLSSVDAYFLTLRSEEMRIYRNNLRYHVLMVLSWHLNGGPNLPAKRIVSLDVSRLDDNVVEEVARWVFDKFEISGAEDRTAKEAKFSNELKTDWSEDAISVADSV